MSLVFTSDENEALAVALDVTIRELSPAAATFFTVAPDAAARLHVARGSGGPGALPQLPFRVDDVGQGRVVESDDHLSMLIRDEGRVVACVTVWRAAHEPNWSTGQQRLAHALQPLVEMAYVSALRGAASINALLPSTLTRRQRQVARMLASGATNVEVARALNISGDTAKSHARAVLGKLGVRSRRELVMALTRHRPDDRPGTPRESTAQGLLSPVLEWAAVRIGAEAGGCAVLSARFEPMEHAWATARGAAHVDNTLVRRLQRQLFPGEGHSEIVCRAVEGRPQAAVLELEPSRVITELGLTAPLLTVLRPNGRVGAVTWLSRNPRATLDQHASAQALRGLHPLLELASAAPLAVAQAPALTIEDLAEPSLTPREYAVAVLAVDGNGNTEIATKLGISEATVKHHMGRVLSKCGVRSRTQLIALVGGGVGH
jgi:DNA-binding NarL/FixJ family response regulator